MEGILKLCLVNKLVCAEYYRNVPKVFMFLVFVLHHGRFFKLIDWGAHLASQTILDE